VAPFDIGMADIAEMTLLRDFILMLAAL